MAEPQIEEEEIEEEVEEEVNEPNEENIALAKSMGWVEEEKFRGDKSRWVSADTFVEKGMNDLPILRERLRNQSRQMDEMKSDMTDFKKYHEDTETRAYQRAFTDIEAKQRATVDDGDSEKYELLQRQKQALATEHRARQVPQAQPENEVVSRWKAERSWYNENPTMRSYAENSAASFIGDTRPELRGTPEFLDAIDDEVKKRFPAYFENKNRNNAPTVESGGMTQRKRSNGRAYQDLPADAKVACDKFVRRGLVTKAQYVKDYEWD